MLSEFPLPSFNAVIWPGDHPDPVAGPKDPDAITWNLLNDPVIDCPWYAITAEGYIELKYAILL